MLKKLEIKLLRELRGEKSIKEIAESISRSVSYTSEIISGLEDKNLINKKRQGKKKLVSPTNSRVVELIQKLGQTHPHMNLGELLSRKSLSVIYYLDQWTSVTKVAERTKNYRATVNRIINRLLKHGVIQKEGRKYKLNDEFEILNELSKGYIHQKHISQVSRHTKDFSLFWESLNEFLVQSGEEIKGKNFHPTGPELFEKYGLPLFTRNRRYYFYSKDLTEVPPSDLICHTLLIDQGSRAQKYCLLLYKKESFDSTSLKKKAKKYGVLDLVESIVIYIQTKGKKKKSKQPEWSEFKKTASDYGVKI